MCFSNALTYTIESNYFYHLFWRVHPKMDDHQFAWILWYIWEGRNNKVFTDLDICPKEMLKFAETVSTLWAEA